MSKLFSDELKLTARDAMGALYPAAQGEEPGGLPLRKLMAAVFRSRFLVIGTTLFGLLIGAFMAVTTPNSYVSTGKFISLGQGAEAIALDPSRAAQTNQETIGASATYVMLNDDVFKRVIARLGPGTILAPYQPEGEGEGMKGFFHQVQRDWNASGGSGSAEEALKRLQRSIHIERPRFTDVFICSCSANDPKLAQLILSAFMEEAKRWHLETYDDPKVYDEVLRLAQSAREALELASRHKRDFLERKAQVQDFDFELKHWQQRTLEIRTKADASRSEVASTKRQIEELEKRRDSLPMQVQGYRKPSTANITAAYDKRMDELIARIVTKQTQSADPERDPEIVSLRKEHKAYEALRAEAIKKALDAPAEPYLEDNPEHRALVEELSTLKSTLVKVTSLADDLERDAAASTTQLKHLLDLEPEYKQLRDAVIAAERDVETTSSSLAAANTKRQLRLGNFSSLKQVENAALPLEKEGPNRGKLIMGGFFVGLFLGMGIIIMRALPDNVVRTREDLERAEGIAVIGVMPRLDSRNLKRHRVLREQGW